MESKILRDPYYKDLYLKNGRDFIESAGYFEDSGQNEISYLPCLNWPVTPINFLKKPTNNKSCVLLLTGSFCPIHAGHIEMMECAKKELEKNGFDVLGGYFSPGHDEYIFSKNKEEAIPINYRIQLIHEATKNIDWLTVDPWEGIFNLVACNFTDVIHRLQLYLAEMFNRDIPVFFVCGADNARFCLTFLFKGNCVVVGRPGYEDRMEQFQDIIAHNVGENNRIFFTDCNNSLSSTAVRKTFKWVRPSKKNLQLRVSGHDLEPKIIEALKPRFNKLEQHDLYKQKGTMYNSKVATISLDSLIQGTYNLQISRKYDLFGISKLGYTERPGCQSFDLQLGDIDRSKEYELFDDDIHTGGTMKFAKKLLNDRGITVSKVSALNITTSSDNEILDARDFIFGIKNCGLVVEMPDGRTTRVPYIYPFVDPSSRCSIDDALDFSIEMWKINKEYWINFTDTLLDRPHLIPLHNGILGEPAETKISDICEYYENYLLMLKNESHGK